MTEMEVAKRRLSNVANHLNPELTLSNSHQIHHHHHHPSISLSTTSMNDNYHKVHGQVSSKPVVWKLAADDSGKDFIDIIYEKAVGEAIAKVITLLQLLLLSRRKVK